MKNSLTLIAALPIAAMVSACSPATPPEPAPRPVRALALQYDNVAMTHRYAATVQSRHEVDQAFRVAGKVTQRKVEVGQFVREGDVLAVLDDADYRLAEAAVRQQWHAAVTQARQAESDRKRLDDLRSDGSVSESDDERARSGAQAAQANADALAQQLELARNRVKYTVLRASRSGLVTAVRFEAGQVVPEGLPMVAIADPAAPEIVVDVPEDRLASFRKAKFRATLATAPGESFEVALRELAPQAAAQTRTFRARLKPVDARRLPLGATATLTVDQAVQDTPMAAVPATALTQAGGQPALWVVRQAGTELSGTVELMPVQVHSYRNEEALVSGPPAGVQVVTAGVQKMAPGLKVALPGAAMAKADNVRQVAP